jgi:hypothetical protein
MLLWRAAFALLMTASTARSQAPPRFEVASIQPHESGVSGIPRGGPGTDDPEHLLFVGIRSKMSDLASVVENQAGLNVFDKTGIDGVYDLKMRIASSDVAGVMRMLFRRYSIR